MRPTLKPMSLGEILDTAVQMMRTNLLLFAGIALIPGIVNLGSQASRSWLSTHPFADTGGIATAIAAVSAFVFFIAIVICDAWASGAKCKAASKIVMGEAVTVRSAYAAFRYRRGRLVGLGIVKSLYSFWPVFLGAIAFVAMHNAVGFVVLGISIACCGFFVARYALAFPATAIMDTTAIESLRRSGELGRGHRWKVLWSYALPGGIGLALNAGGAGLITWFRPIAARHGSAAFVWLAMGDFWTFLVSRVFGPLTSIAITLAYYDLCVRKEGLDIEQMMERAGMPPTAAYAANALVQRPAEPL